MDASAQSTSADRPAFLAKPHGAPVYHGFRILEDVNVDGFTLGVITDFEVEPAVYGDAFVVAPGRQPGGARLGDLRHSQRRASLRGNRRALGCLGSLLPAPNDESAERDSKPWIGIAAVEDEVGSLAAVAPRQRAR